jgi:hypothetical protein
MQMTCGSDWRCKLCNSSAIRREVSVSADETVKQNNWTNTRKGLVEPLANLTGCDVAKWFVVQYKKTIKNIQK